MASTTSVTTTGIRTWSPGRVFALASAVVYIGAGVIGFVVTGFDAAFTGLAETKVLILAINPLHNIIHLALGAGYAVGASSDRNARNSNLVIGAGLLAAFAVGVFGGAEFINIDGAPEPDNWLHLIWGSASVWFGVRATSR